MDPAGAGQSARLAADAPSSGDVPGEAVSASIAGDALGNLLRGTSDADAIHGKGGDHTLIGLGGDDFLQGGDDGDRLLGGAGADDLTGGRRADRFLFGGGFGVDTITDFQDDMDTIHLRLASLGVTSLADALSHARVMDGDTVFTFDTGDRLIVENLTDMNLLQNDIAFV
jgi:Ca2+-binding RTX toxin-like protein